MIEQGLAPIEVIVNGSEDDAFAERCLLCPLLTLTSRRIVGKSGGNGRMGESTIYTEHRDVRTAIEELQFRRGVCSRHAAKGTVCRADSEIVSAPGKKYRVVTYPTFPKPDNAPPYSPTRFTTNDELLWGNRQTIKPNARGQLEPTSEPEIGLSEAAAVSTSYVNFDDDPLGDLIAGTQRLIKWIWSKLRKA